GTGGGGAGAGGGVMGGGGSGAGGAGGSGGAVPIGATFSSLKANVFTPLCKNCHGTTYERYDELVVAVPTKAGNDACVKDPAYAGKPILIAGDAANSLLYKKLALDDSGCGARMPQGGAPLSQEQIDAVKQWIDAGANDN
ncbi:MAG TPA: hypothetical protein VFS00_08695, partial [Polyangiaceae bacterium]|nr:hypothetical protein [Polyangiaceae bacterium]